MKSPKCIECGRRLGEGRRCPNRCASHEPGPPIDMGYLSFPLEVQQQIEGASAQRRAGASP